MGTFLGAKLGPLACPPGCALIPDVPEYDALDYETELGPTGSVLMFCPDEPISNQFLTNIHAGEGNWQPNKQHEITFEPVPVEIVFLEPPPDEFNIEPTRFRKTYSYFRQRPRKF